MMIEIVIRETTTTPSLNTSSNVTDDVIAASSDVMEQRWMRAIFISLYAVIVMLGVSGNSIVVFVVMRNPSMQTITNLFITNLAVSDVMMCLLAAPFTPLSAWMKSWVFGEVLCHLVPMTLGVSVFVSTLTSTAIAVDRYFVIVYPFRGRMKSMTCVILIVVIWVVSCSISLPMAIYQKVEPLDGDVEGENGVVYTCLEAWPKPTDRRFFTLITLVLQYIVPCSIITFCYCRVSRVLRTRARAKIGAGRANRERHEVDLRRKRRTNRMLIAMVSIFVCCWFPLNVIHLTSDYSASDIETWSYFHLLFFTAHVIAMSSTVYNPFLYGWMNENFRKEFLEVLPCLGPLLTAGRWRRRRGAGGPADHPGTAPVDYRAIKAQIPLKTRRASKGLNGGKTVFLRDDTEALCQATTDHHRNRVILADCACALNDNVNTVM